jgi:hypothetical protein
VYIDAALRHIHKWQHGQEIDSDSGIHHLGHAIACLNIVLDAQAFGNLIDDRPPADNSPLTLDEARKDVERLTRLRGKEVPSTPPITETDGPTAIQASKNLQDHIFGIGAFIQKC